jgi:hypothetical protein
VSALEQSSAVPPSALSVWRFFAGWLAALRPRWDAALHCPEVDRDPRLKIICGCLLLYFQMTFSAWREQAAALSTLGNELFNYAPAPLLENFRWLVFMDHFQTQTWLYAQGMLALLGLFSLFLLPSSRLAVGLLGWLFVNKVYFYVTDFRLFSNFHHFHLLYTLVFLISADKLRFFRGALVVSYFLSGLVKLTPSWLFGEYFNALPEKLPLLPKLDWLVTAASISVIALEFLGPLCWFTRLRWLRRLSFGAFLGFHLYSGVIVGFWYTTLMLPLVAAAFLGFKEPLHAGYQFARRHLATFGIFIIALCGGFYPLFIPGDVRLTGEGRYFGLFMFDANHAVRFQARIRKGDQMWVVQVYRRWQHEHAPETLDSGIRAARYRDQLLVETFEVNGPIRDDGEIIFNPDYFTAARMRISGDPYLYYFYARELVRRHQPDRVSIRLDRRLDGHPEFVTLLNIPDFAALNPTYRSFTRNEWIQLPGPESPSTYRWP